MAPTIRHLRFASQPILELTLHDCHFTVAALKPGEEPHIEFRGDPGDFEPSERLSGLVIHAHDLKARLAVPAHVRLSVRMHDSKLFFEKLSGCDLNILSSDSVTELDQVHGRLVATVSEGVIGGKALSGTFDVKGTASQVNLAIDHLDAGDHLVRSLMGTAKIDLAEGLQARLEMAATLGSARSSFKSVASAAAVMRVEADVGSVRVSSSRRHVERHGDYPSWQRIWLRATFATEETGPAHDAQSRLRKILEMVKDGAVTPEEGKRLVNAVRHR